MPNTHRSLAITGKFRRCLLVLIHGTSASLHIWDGWVTALTKQHRVIRFDLPGFGLTGPAPDGDYSLERYTRFVAATLDALAQRFAQNKPGQLAERIPALRLPVLILWGGRDHLIPVENGQRFKQDIPGSQLQIFDDLGHVPQEEDPQRTVQAVADFIAIGRH